MDHILNKRFQLLSLSNGSGTCLLILNHVYLVVLRLFSNLPMTEKLGIFFSEFDLGSQFVNFFGLVSNSNNFTGYCQDSILNVQLKAIT